ncbi:MAG: site-specific integrase [Opitutaceae bacterium]
MYLGTQGELRRQRRFFVRREDAERFVAKHTTTPIPIGELWERRAEILYAFERLRPLGTNLTDAVTFYLGHRGSALGQAQLREVVDEFLREKLQSGRSQQYDRVMRRCFSQFLEHIGVDRRVGEISREEITDYVYKTNKRLSPISKKNVLTNLSVLFNFTVRRDLLKENPVEKIDRPIVPFKKPHVLIPTDFERLLRTCYNNGWNDRLTIFVLVGFCGIRTEEGSRLKWSNVQLDRQIIEVPATVAKKASFRNNRIPPNAMDWLRLVEDKRRTGSIIGPTWESQLRTAIISSRITYHQNAIRHSFCSYAIGAGWSLAEIISYMGHSGSPSVIHSHYRNVVSEEDGKKWFSIVP